MEHRLQGGVHVGYIAKVKGCICFESSVPCPLLHIGTKRAQTASSTPIPDLIAATEHSSKDVAAVERPFHIKDSDNG